LGNIVVQSVLGLLGASFMWRLAWFVHRTPYPVRLNMYRRPPKVLLVASLSLVLLLAYPIMQGVYPLPIALVLVAAAGTSVFVAIRHYVGTSLYYNSYGRPISAWRAFVAAMYYLKCGPATVEVYRQPRYDHYRLVIRSPDEGNLVNVEVKRDQVSRLLASLAAHYPFPRRLRPGWAVTAIFISSSTYELPASVRHRIAPVFQVEQRRAA
jgi:hypothetical protein